MTGTTAKGNLRANEKLPDREEVNARYALFSI
jgi:hypothetical protein